MANYEGEKLINQRMLVVWQAEGKEGFGNGVKSFGCWFIPEKRKQCSMPSLNAKDCHARLRAA